MTNYADFNLVDPGYIARHKGPPLEYFEWLRNSDPVHWNPPPKDYECMQKGGSLTQGFWVLSRYDDVQFASRKPAIFSSAVGGPVIWDFEPAELARQQAGIMGMDDPAHAHLKRLVVPPFHPKSMVAFESRIAEKVRQIVDDIAHKGKCELVFDVASRLPVATFCELMGIPEEDRERIFTLGNLLADTERPGAGAEDAMQELFAYSTELAAAKRAAPDDSMLSLYANGEVDGEKIPDMVISMFFVTMSIAGHETTRNTLAHFFRLMQEYPEQYAKIKADPDQYLAGAIHEVLRFCPPVMQFRRTCTEDVELGGKLLKQGDKVYLSYVSANRDSAVFENPNVFDIARPNAARHLSFGVGPHVCLGARLATTQLAMLIREILQRLPDLHISGELEYLNSIWFHAIMKMPVSFTPGD